MNRLFYLNHSAVYAHFTKNSKDFVVTEIPLYEFSGEGEHLILKIRKKDLTTWGMLSHLSEVTGVKVRDFGYAGLKDKDGMTIQHVSMPKKFEASLEKLNHQNIKILEKNYHNNKLKTGHLKGNRFFIRLKKVNPTDAQKLKEIIKTIKKEGFPNYFGYQRFGREGDNYDRGRDILEGTVKERNKKMRNFFISAYQSHLFNLWLSKRVEISKLFASFNEEELFNLFNFPKEIIKKVKSQPAFFKMLPGDVLHHYPHGRIFICENLEEEAERFTEKGTTITGVLPGAKATCATGIASSFEKDFTKECEPYLSKMQGTRRFAWIWAENIESHYKEDEAQFEFSFTLPKGSYATVLLEELTHITNFN
ncbi:MAG: tRNA pseudouridine(13) synthase TruD [Epsilonproteobacteria bacterium]|nr:tRNA pseudouridine(13) synthase TruD [Campylobacterota bacterium]